MAGWFQWFIVLWSILLITLFFIGGYFMFRKFLKRLPKEDGKSILDWEDYYIEKTKHLWSQEQRDLLEELVKPVPELFRDVARNKIAGKIGKIAVEQNAKEMNQEMIIKGYILATPKRDHKWLIKTLHEKHIDVQPYQHLF
ncbi:DUF2621 domain-containing protein [Pseudalkalibacillus caeni]|uniref:DUF2621 domain-containing protein n=1 Tax=Exobacillus caeni TaxID=2574798 RepID=A0A5R9F1C2_9BACL|nr:DUF2621 domain-containing protein [Pseudalkalibacillus caeni]TLS37432.1 DUF2621 domain-containing protein [Pseudalkalibacillus caeni]